MAKKKSKNKYYAIKVGRGVENKIVTTWKECSELVLGYNSIYKSFTSREDAEIYLGKISSDDIPQVLENNIKAREYNSRRKKGTKSLQGIRIDNELYSEFENKCEEMEFTKERAIELLLREWVE